MKSEARVAIAPPAVTVVQITEPTAASEGLELAQQDAVQLQPEPLRARRVIVRLDAAVVVFNSTNRRLRTRTRIHTGLLAYVAFGPHANGTVNGLPIRPGLMLAAAPDTEARFVVDPGWESVNFLLPPAQVSGQLAARRRVHEFHVPRGIEPMQADPEGASRLFDWGKRLAVTAARQPALFDDGTHQRAAARAELFEILLPLLGVSGQLEPTRADRTRQAQDQIVAIAERHAESQVGEPVSVSDLCQVVGVSERTLEYAFRAVMGLTPVSYLTRVRLHRVRQGLLAATHGSTTVSAEALKLGFWHFGEFSRAYRNCFGELPSDTLRRASARSR